MSLEEFGVWGWTLVSSGLGWWLHVMWVSHKEMAKDMNALALKTTEDLAKLAIKAEQEYVRKTELAPLLRDIKEAVQRIEDKLDQKADKS